MIGIGGTRLTADEREFLESPIAAGVILFSRNFTGLAQLRQLVAEIHAVRAPALLVAVDQEGGRVQRLCAPFTRLPPVRLLGRLYDADPAAAVESARDLGWLMAAELRACDIDLSFAPVVDIDLGLADVIGDRAFHDTADGVVALSLAYVAGMREAGMAATAKHFPTHAGVHADTHTELAEDPRDYPDLVDDLLPYRALIHAGLHSVMVAHVAFPSLDPAPASMSTWWIEQQLRGELEFSGAVISDDLGMHGASSAGTVAERVVKVLTAGCDLALICNDGAAIPSVADALDGYLDPAAQLRLMRLRPTLDFEWAELRESARWKAAIGRLESLESKPEFHLEG